MNEYQEYLPSPESKPEAIADALRVMAKEIWPEEYAKAEEWVKQQLIRYGIAEAKSQAVQVSQSSWTWVIGGVVLALIFTRKKR